MGEPDDDFTYMRHNPPADIDCPMCGGSGHAADGESYRELNTKLRAAEDRMRELEYIAETLEKNYREAMRLLKQSDQDW